jgi:AAA domain
LASANFVASNPVNQTDEDASLQQKFVEQIRHSGKDRNEFGSLDELRALVLRDGFCLGKRRRPPHNLPYSSLGTLLKGREDFLTGLRRSLQQTQSGHVAATVVHGLGGVGKTRLAVEYAWQHEQDYSALLFVVADSPENLRRNLAGLTGSLVLDLPEKSHPDEELRRLAAVRWLEQHDGWLLVLDNVDTPKAATAAEEILPRLRGGHVLITSLSLLKTRSGSN